ncbi:E3 ubiquitin-protein ligase RNF170-like [Notechis scutatus]|uniref:E3 ubiquitin-protein ligase RNF170-like n=1 Tax=Notechis scutatus TaxID=8663 RepID=A0A6J1TUR4_9SAUR|nr:E3 ubiquitin-protein ligase RNF170-like [Notechis scutatus]XP_026521739.1 E3 ubiquitin-protein ligase RNF170-like [Notechis scutatus]XP_026521740.1 E3 ubiquitin-protein ligase RNF170-like [Notechis scutatus]XP_026521741.1 E3 ubiquitin-protein ligase RNF170-like [Notechis scutatus]XP_026521742.1 E3 ubiquitin-protein ligase RNF170-like [Notechis scutatus]XP_026521743.1 E3 ubiquitin-protein ligase RNF170-like [Notechis scutatus]
MSSLEKNCVPSSSRIERLQQWQQSYPSDLSCPICLQTANFPVETNCGHFFCGYCLIQYWKHGSWLSAINCPLCRQKVVFLYTCSENQPDKKNKQTFYDIRTYNKRFSGLPQSFIDHLYDMPLLLLVILRGIFTLTALVWIFLFRVVICFFGTIMCSTCPPEGMPEPLCGILQTADNLAVMLLLLISFINICPQMESEGANRTISRE